MLPPGPRRPAALQMLEWTYRPVRFMEMCRRRFGDAFTVRLPSTPPFVFLSDPAHIKQVFLEKPERLLAGKGNKILEPVLGPNSLLLLDGAEHLRQRKLLLPPFHGERMAAYGELMREITLASLAQWPLNTPFAIHPFMQRITLEVILRAVFGLEEGAKMRDLAALLIEFLTPPPFVLSFLPALWLDVPFSPYRKFLRSKERVSAALLAIIAERRRAADASKRADILSLLLAARDEEGRALTDDELRDELVTLLAAGHETTATALSWAFERILATPAVAGRIDAELEAGQHAYLDATMKETLRLRPILPIVVREVQDEEYEIAGHRVPRGTMLAPCIYLAQRRPQTWAEPERFIPDRFMDVKPDPYAWLPFGGGIRRCIGMAFAQYEMGIVLGAVLSSARLRLVHESRIVRRSITFAPENGTQVVLVERRSRAAARAA